MGAVAAAARLIVEVRLALDSPDPYAVLALSRIETRQQAAAFLGGALALAFRPSWGWASLLASVVLLLAALSTLGAAFAFKRRNPAVR